MASFVDFILGYEEQLEEYYALSRHKTEDHPLQTRANCL